jgi:hypothetical protein
VSETVAAADRSWIQPDLPLIDPTEPRILPQDGQAWFTINWLSPGGRLSRYKAFQIDEMETILRLTAGQPNLYMSQCLFDRPVRRHPFVQHVTHAWADLDSYNIPRFANRPRDDMVREIRRRCDGEGIPQPSAIIGSGRGYYPKWYFTEPVGREGVGSMVGLNRALVRHLGPLGADPKATDCTRILRVTGSEHTGAGRMVELLHLEHRDGHTITYDADAFARQIAPEISEAPSDVQLLPVANTEREARSNRVAGAFTREGWHWTIVEDCYTLARLRWGGTVSPGLRDLFGHVIACQLARIFPPEILYREIIAAVSRILPIEYTARDLASHCSTLLRLAKDASARGNWTQIYRYGKVRMIDMLQITPDEEQHMRALISDAESYRRKLVAQTNARRTAGMVERAEYEARAAGMRPLATAMRNRGMSWRAIGSELNCSHEWARRMCCHERVSTV